MEIDFIIKMAVPKKKTARSYSKTRYTHYVREAQKRIAATAHAVDCPDCGGAHLSHCVCTECGKYKGRQILTEKNKSEKTTRIQA